ncbi:MAG: DUF2782 domain-containing protein [Burkholderiales bacterium]|nr:DUF2782 domain-containing protein [Burkholderiales bacterium]
MRSAFLTLVMILYAASALAQNANLPPEPPPDLEPLPETLPPPPGIPPEGDLEPQVTIIKRGENTIEEYRYNGTLYLVKVTPPHGVPYYLIDRKGDGNFSRSDVLDGGVSPPMWVIHQF